MTRIFLEEKKFSSGVLQIFVQHLEERGIIIMASFQRAFNSPVSLIVWDPLAKRKARLDLPLVK